MGPVWEDPRVRRGTQAQLELRRGRLREGDRRVGWKVAFGAPQSLEQLRLAAPVIGFLTSRSLVESGTTYSVDGWAKPALEPEIAVHMGGDVGGGATLDDVRGAIAGLGPAIELADVDRPFEQLEQILADNVFHRAVILGPPEAGRRDGRRLRARVLRNGAEVAATDEPAAFAGDPVEIVRHVADLLAAFGERLQGGDVVITGSVVPLLWPTPGDHFAVELDPIGRLEVTFAGTV